MWKEFKLPINNSIPLGDKLCRWMKSQKYGLVLLSNNYQYRNPLQKRLQQYQLLAGLGVVKIISPTSDYFQILKNEVDKRNWLFGYLGYDLKNSIEKLKSEKPDMLGFQDMFFYVPQVVFALTNDALTLHYHSDFYNHKSVRDLFHEVLASPQVDGQNDKNIKINVRYKKHEYIDTIQKVLQHIQRGDIYEMNLCQEFYASPYIINPYETFIHLNAISPTPFSAFGRFDDKFLLCASPERYLRKIGDKIVSQPIKGTIRKGNTHAENTLLMQQLRTDEKERAENIMIVDLVRNDLSRVAQRSTVKVDELCGIYPFQQVSQMISTVSCKLKEEKHPVDAIMATFPMGSMTGAPKVRAMQLIEQYERSRRGLFSGAVGYFSPKGDFDFNVVIRTLLYNATLKYFSFTVGGAITANSIPEKEYEECLLKASAIAKVLGIANF
jgi:para-aminobenzoate synthetase component 1